MLTIIIIWNFFKSIDARIYLGIALIITATVIFGVVYSHCQNAAQDRSTIKINQINANATAASANTNIITGKIEAEKENLDEQFKERTNQNLAVDAVLHNLNSNRHNNNGKRPRATAAELERLAANSR